MRRLICFKLLIFVPYLVAQSNTNQSSLPRDSSVVALLEKSIGASGGLQAMQSVKDYSASGIITYHISGGDVSGSVTIQAIGLNQLRIDATIGDDIRSIILDRGRILRRFRDSSSSTAAPNRVQQATLVVPSLAVVAAYTDPHAEISSSRLDSSPGLQAYKVHLVWGVPPHFNGAERLKTIYSMNMFIDQGTSQIIGLQFPQSLGDRHPGSISRELRFADFHDVNGIVVPFTIDEYLGGQHTSTIHLSAVNFNVGLKQDLFR